MTLDHLLGGAALVAAALLYLLPLLVGAHRDVPPLRRLVLVNVLLGWTVLGWLYCLALAVRRPRPRPATPRASAWRDPSLQDRPPAWLSELPAADRRWRSLPRDTAAMPLDRDPEQQ